MFVPELEIDKNRDAIKDYIAYIDRTRRTTGQSRYEIHQLMMTRNTGLYYGLSDKDFELLNKQFLDELNENNNTTEEINEVSEEPKVEDYYAELNQNMCTNCEG